jgi:hypothetical protein
MQLRSFRTRRAAVVALFAMVVVSCGDAVGPEEGPPLVVTPAGPLDLLVGDTITIRSTAPTGVTDIVYASSQPEVISVDQKGLVTALSPGEARVTVASEGTTRAAAVVVTRVSTRGPASVVIESLLNEQNLPVTPTGVAGVVFARMHLQRGDAARLEVLFGSTVACSQNFANSATAAEGPSFTSNPTAAVDCPIDTAAFNPTTGEPRFFNGPVQVTARLVRIDGRALATATFPTVTLANPNRLVATITPSREATDTQGRVWTGGDLDVTALPVLFEEGLKLLQVNFFYLAPGPTPYMMVDSVPPFHLRLPADALNTVLDERLHFSITSVTSRFTRGPETATPEIRYDGSPPVPGTFRARDWIGEDVEFASLYVPPAVPDGGVGRVNVRFFGGDPGLTAGEVVRNSPPVTRGGDLPQASVGAYRMIFEVCDALQNCLARGAFLFGVDVTPPTLESVSIPHRAVNPGADLRIQAKDDLSGFSDRALEVSVLALRPDAAQPVCGPTLEGRSLPGRVRAGTCAPDTIGFAVPVPRQSAGYYTYRMRAVDVAGNRSPAIERTYLVDTTPPVLNSFTVPSQFVPGEEATFAAEVADNLDLAEVSFRLGFPGATRASPRLALPFGAAATAGTPFSGTLTRSFSASTRFPFVRTLTYSTAGTTSRSTVLVDSAQVRVTDAAGLVTRGSRALLPASFGGNASVADPFSALGTVVPLINTQRVCTAGCTASDPTAVTVTIRLAGEPGLSALSRMYLFVRDDAGVVNQITSTPTFAVTETGTQRTYTYTVTFTPPVGATGAMTVFGVGLSPSGNALKTDDLALEFFAR